MVYGHACKINANKTYHWLHGVYQRVETGNLMQAVAISTCICRSGFSTAYATANFIICIMTSKQRPWHDDPAMIGTTFYNTLMTRLWSAMIGTFYNTLMTRLWSAMIGTTFYNTLGLLISNQYRSRDCVGDHQTGCSGEDGNYIGDLGLFISTKTLFWWIITYTFSSKIICPNL